MRRDYFLFFVLAALGLVASLWSANEWYQLFLGLRTTSSVCTLNSYWNCDRASLSALGAIGLVPIGVFGALWFWTVGVLGLSSWRKSAFFIFWLWIGMGFAILSIADLLFILKTGCLLCFSVDACLLGIFIYGKKLRTQEWDFKTGQRTSLGLSVLGIFLLGIFTASNVWKMTHQIPEEEFKNYFQSLTRLDLPPVTPFKKGSTAPQAIQVIEFFDYACPFCQRASETLIPYLNSQPDVGIQIYPFPLESECNPQVVRTAHPHACEWTRAAICAEDQGVFWKVHDQIFRLAEERDGLPPLNEAIEDFPVNLEKLKACLNSHETDVTLRKLIDVATLASATNTPTFVVGGLKIEGFKPVPVFKRLLEELRRNSNSSGKSPE